MTSLAPSFGAPAPYRIDVSSTVSRPGALEQSVTFIMLVALTLGLPNEWFVTYQQIAEIDTGGGVIPTLVFLILGAGLSLRLIGNWHLVLEGVRREPLIAFLLALALASVLWSPDLIASFRRFGAFLIASLFGYYLVVRYELAKINRMLALVLMMGTILNYLWVFALPQYGLDLTIDANWNGITSNRNVLGRLSVLGALVFSIAYREHRAMRYLYLLFLGLQLPLVLGAGSKTSLASFVVTPCLLIIYQLFRARKTLYGAVAVSLFGAGALGLAVATASLGAITKALDRDVTLTGRTVLWEDLWGVGQPKFFTGFGWEGFWGGWFSPSHEVWIRHDWLPPTAHNAYLDMFLSLGIFGLFAMVMLVARGVIRASRHVRYVPGAIGLWPLGYFSMLVMISITESGVAGRTIFWPLLVVASVHGARLSRRVLSINDEELPELPAKTR